MVNFANTDPGGQFQMMMENSLPMMSVVHVGGTGPLMWMFGTGVGIGKYCSASTSSLKYMMFEM